MKHTNPNIETPSPPPEPMPPLTVPPSPRDIPPQIPPEIREPDQPGENLPISDNLVLPHPNSH